MIDEAQFADFQRALYISFAMRSEDGLRRAAIFRLALGLPRMVLYAAICFAVMVTLQWLFKSRDFSLRHVLRRYWVAFLLLSLTVGFVFEYVSRLLGTPRIRPSSDGFCRVRGKRVTRHVRWHQILAIAACRRRAEREGEVTTSLMLRLRNDEWLEVGEDIDGFEWLAAQTYERFQVRPGWRESLHGQPRWIALWGIALPPDRLCVSCGYDLTGNRSGRCPECGITCRWPHSTADIDADGE